MNKYLSLIILTILVGCNDAPKEDIRYNNVIPDNKKKEASEWILKVVEAANPHSDEEPEDNIKQAEWTAIKLFGEPTIGIRTWNYSYWVFIPYDKCNERQKRMCDKFLETGQ